MASIRAQGTYKSLQMHILHIYRHAHTKHVSTQLRCFSCWAPAAWGQLPVSVQHAASVSSFGSSLRIFLFLGIFSSVPLPWSVSVCAHVCQCVLSLICCQYTYVRRICKCLGPSADGIQTHKRFRRTLFIRTKTTCTFWG